jgi:undecaprenyl-diphosphatase
LSALQAIVLGIIQGATEFLPVSSSAHLALAHWITGWHVTGEADLVFDVALHFGTLIAIVAYFARDWVDMFKRRDKVLWFVLIACVPGAIVGALLEKKVEDSFHEDPLLIAIMLGAMAFVLAAAEWRSRRNREMTQMTWGDAVLIGVAQALAVVPGVSRSGITITAGLFAGLTREAAARFSFLLSTPIIAGAALWEGRKLIHGAGFGDPLPNILGILTSAIVGLACVHFLLSFLRKHTFYPFVIYRLVLAAVVLVAVLVHGH